MASLDESVRPELVPAAFERPLPSGRMLVVRVGERKGNSWRSATGGGLELSINLTEAGPMVRIRGGPDRPRVTRDDLAAVPPVRGRGDRGGPTSKRRGGGDRRSGVARSDQRRRPPRRAMIRLNCDPPPGESCSHRASDRTTDSRGVTHAQSTLGFERPPSGSGDENGGRVGGDDRGDGDTCLKVSPHVAGDAGCGPAHDEHGRASHDRSADADRPDDGIVAHAGGGHSHDLHGRCAWGRDHISCDRQIRQP